MVNSMEETMRPFDVQGIVLNTASERAFEFIPAPEQLPRWTQAFASAGGGRARMRKPAGEVEIELTVQASAEQGTVDWLMRFPDGSIATAFSRVVPLSARRCAYCFVLTPLPVPLEQLEGALEEQSRTLAAELLRLQKILDQHG